MRYIFVSDIHGNLDKLQIALKEAHFKPHKDTLVSLGDPFDRGTQNLEVLKFLMSLPNRILVAGNHDLRLKYILLGADGFNRYDHMNGLDETLYDLCNHDKIYGSGALIYALKNSAKYRDNYRLLRRYFDECVYGLEWKDLIAVHGWIPTIEVQEGNKVYRVFDPQWRTAGDYEWYDATWADTKEYIKRNLFPEKRMVIGHWHAYDLSVMYQGNTVTAYETTTNDAFETKEFIAIDGCTAAPDGKVNTYIYESKEKPFAYSKQYIRHLK